MRPFMPSRVRKETRGRVGAAGLILMAIVTMALLTGSNLLGASPDQNHATFAPLATVGWTQVSPVNAPGARYADGMVSVAPTTYGDNGEFVFGGINSVGTLLSDTWVYNPHTSAWRQVCLTSVCGPSPRWGATLIYGDTWVLLFGGCAAPPTSAGGCPSSSVLGDTWVFGVSPSSPGSPGCPNKWVQVFPTTSPSSRYDSPGMAPYPGANIGYLFGGESPMGTALSGTWAFTPGCNLVSGGPTNPWTRVTVSGATPSPRWGSGFAGDQSSVSSGILFGGESGSPAILYGDTYGFLCTGGCSFVGSALATGTWTFWSSTGPSPSELMGLAGTYNSYGQVTLFGGQTATGSSANTWLWNQATLTWTQWLSGTFPSARFAMGFVYDDTVNPGIGVDYMFGGNGSSVLQDLWTFS